MIVFRFNIHFTKQKSTKQKKKKKDHWLTKKPLTVVNATTLQFVNNKMFWHCYFLLADHHMLVPPAPPYWKHFDRARGGHHLPLVGDVCDPGENSALWRVDFRQDFICQDTSADGSSGMSEQFCFFLSLFPSYFTFLKYHYLSFSRPQSGHIGSFKYKHKRRNDSIFVSWKKKKKPDAFWNWACLCFFFPPWVKMKRLRALSCLCP